eukprot:9474132-Pyramimonas_sp.AAC.1
MDDHVALLLGFSRWEDCVNIQMTPVIRPPYSEHHFVQRNAREEGDAPEILVVLAMHRVMDVHPDLGLPGRYP